MLACLLATRAASIERLLAVGQLLSSGCLLCWCAGQLPDDCSSNTVRCGYLFAVFYTLRSYISAAADTVFLWEAAPTNGNARRGCPAQPTRYFWARDCCSAVGRLAAVLPAPRQRRGAPRLESKCRLDELRAPGILTASASLHTTAERSPGRTGRVLSKRTGSARLLPSGVIAGGAAKSHLHRRKSVRRAWSQGPRDVATGGAATKAALRRRPSAGALQPSVDAAAPSPVTSSTHPLR